MRLCKSKFMLLALVVVMICAVCSIGFAGKSIEQKSTLSGVVLIQDLVKVGEKVNEGQVLVRVKTIAGAAPAVRANTSGTVSDVFAKPDEAISSGQIVVRIITG